MAEALLRVVTLITTIRPGRQDPFTISGQPYPPAPPRPLQAASACRPHPGIDDLFKSPWKAGDKNQRAPILGFLGSRDGGGIL